MKENYTHISMVLDRSGSMAGLAHDTVGGVNTFVKAHREAPGECTFTLVQFNNTVETVFKNQPVKIVPELTRETYCPLGLTALNDAVARTIIQTGDFLASLPADKRPSKVIFVIVTDGEENMSQEYGGEDGRRRVFEMINHQTECYQWEFVFIGANQDSFKAGGGLGIRASNVMNYAANAGGVKSCYDSVATNSVKMRTGGKRDMSFEAHDYKAQADAGAANPTMPPTS